MSTYKNLINEIDSIIRLEGVYTQYGYSLQFNSLEEHDQQKIAALFIEYDDRDLFSLYENDDYDDIVSSLLVMLSKDNKKSDKDFTTCLKEKLVQFYAKRAQDLIDERCTEVEALEMWEHAKFNRQDRNTGEFYWSRI